MSLAANKTADRLSQKLDRAPTVAEIAAELRITEEEALEALELSELYEPALAGPGHGLGRG